MANILCHIIYIIKLFYNLMFKKLYCRFYFACGRSIISRAEQRLEPVTPLTWMPLMTFI